MYTSSDSAAKGELATGKTEPEPVPAHSALLKAMLKQIAADASLAQATAIAILRAAPSTGARMIARTLGVTLHGYRPDRAPQNLLLSELAKRVKRDPRAIEVVFDQFATATADTAETEVWRVGLGELKAKLPEMVREYSPVCVWLWLSADPRRGAQELAKTLVRQVRQGAELRQMEPGAEAEPQAADRVPITDGHPGAGEFGPEPREARPKQAKTQQAPSGRAIHRQLNAEKAAKRKAEAKAARLQGELEKTKDSLRQSRREAATTGQQVGALRKELASAQAELERARRAEGPARLPVVIEAPAFAELQAQLGASDHENERLRVQLAKTERELRQTCVVLKRQERTTRRLQARLARSPAVEAGPQAFTVTRAFEYRGLGGTCPLKSGYEITIPANVVGRLGLIHGDTVCLTLLPLGLVRMQVVAQAARRTRHALVRELRPDGPEAQTRLWQAVPIRGLASFSEEGRPGRIAPLGWIAGVEVARLDLRDGDPITVIAPRANEEGIPVSSPRAGLPALPIVKVLRKHEVPEAADVTEAAPEPRPRRQRPTTVSRGRLGRARPAARPLAGLTVLIVGGDSFHVNYRQVVHGLGGEVDFVEAAGGDPPQTKARARAADVTVLITPYLSHKAQNTVLEALDAAGKSPLYVNTRGQKAVLEALLGWARKRGVPTVGGAEQIAGTVHSQGGPNCATS